MLYKDKYCSVLGTLESRYNTRRWRIKWELIAFQIVPEFDLLRPPFRGSGIRDSGRS